MTDSEQVMEWAKSQGAVVCNDPKERQRLLDYIVPVAAVFPDMVKQVNATYVYRMEEQKKKAAGADGMSWKDVAGEGHTSAFHDKLNEMIDIYNKATGANIANDFFAWPSRYDCRPYSLSVNRKKM